MPLSLSSSTSCPGMPLMIDPYRGSAFEATTLLMLIRLMEPIAAPSGARMRLPRRMKMGAFETSRMVRFETRHVFDVRSIDAFQRQAAGSIENDVGDGNVMEVAFRFRADLD